jgi:hypothetical protein
MTVVMYDSIDLSQFPSNPEAVAGYVGGYWPTYNDLVKKFPNAKHLSIAVTAAQRARCLDIEPGNATPSQGPGWFRNYADKSQGLPVIYAGASAINQVTSAMTNGGIARSQYLLWSAHYTYKEHICSPGGCGYPSVDGTQWTDKAHGRNLDQSLCSDAFFGKGAPAKPADAAPEDTQELITVVKADGRLETFARTSSGQVWHRWQTTVNGSWTDSWQSLGTPGS